MYTSKFTILNPKVYCMILDKLYLQSIVVHNSIITWLKSKDRHQDDILNLESNNLESNNLENERFEICNLESEEEKYEDNLNDIEKFTVKIENGKLLLDSIPLESKGILRLFYQIGTKALDKHPYFQVQRSSRITSFTVRNFLHNLRTLSGYGGHDDILKMLKMKSEDLSTGYKLSLERDVSFRLWRYKYDKYFKPDISRTLSLKLPSLTNLIPIELKESTLDSSEEEDVVGRYLKSKIHRCTIERDESGEYSIIISHTSKPRYIRKDHENSKSGRVVSKTESSIKPLLLLVDSDKIWHSTHSEGIDIDKGPFSLRWKQLAEDIRDGGYDLVLMTFFDTTPGIYFTLRRVFKKAKIPYELIELSRSDVFKRYGSRVYDCIGSRYFLPQCRCMHHLCMEMLFHYLGGQDGI